MAESAFGDSLFDEFDRDPQPADKILRQKFKDDNLKNKSIPFSGDVDSDRAGNSPQSESDSTVYESESETGNEGETAVSLGDTEKSVSSMLSMLRQSVECHEGPEAVTSNGESDLVSGRYLKIQEEFDTIQQEKTRLAKVSKLVSEKIIDDEGPAIQVVYMNHKVSRKYRGEIEEFITGLITKEGNISRQLPILQKRENAVNIAVNDPVAHLSEEKIRQSRACTAVGCSQLYNEFMLDSMGWPLVESNTSLTDGWQLPTYEQVYKSILPCDSDSEDDEAAPKRRQKASCFNCAGEHILAECKMPKDFKRINKARTEFRSQASTPHFSRYTMDSLMSKYETLKPGSISKQLRDAIGISPQQLPPYIYQMRMFGYPPGWLKDAEVESSGISMFDKHGKEVSQEVENEEGELEQTQKKMLNPSKLVTYPGFNVPAAEDVIDDCERLGMPSMQPNQQLEVLRVFLSQQYELSSGTKRKHSTDGECGSSSSKKRRGELPSSDMDMSVDHGASPPSVRSHNGSTTSSRPETPSLSELEGQQRALQRQLAEEMSTVADSSSPPMPPTPDRPPLPIDTPPATPGTPGESSDRGTPGMTSDLSTPGVTSDRGTPGESSDPGTPGESSDPATPEVPSTPPLPPTPDRPPLPLGTPPVTPQTPQDGVFRTPYGITPIKSAVNQKKTTNQNESTPISSSSNRSSIDDSVVEMGDDITTPSSIPLNRTLSLSTSVGTPILEGGTPSSEGKKLPSANKFADGITEHLPFENLPNSTGKYAEVKKLIDSAKNLRNTSS